MEQKSQNGDDLNVSQWGSEYVQSIRSSIRLILAIRGLPYQAIHIFLCGLGDISRSGRPWVASVDYGPQHEHETEIKMLML